MSTRRDDDEFLPIVGLNLSVPIAKDQDAALCLVNCRPDRLQGRIRSRLGHGTAIHTYADNIHTIWMYAGSNRYIGAGTALFRDTTSVVTGLDGNRLFLATKNKFTWVMNRSSQKRVSDAGVVSNWYTAPPASALTAADSGLAGNVNGTVEYYVTFVDADGFETGGGPVAVLTVTAKIVNLTAIPTGPAGTTARNIYRGGGTLEDVFLVQTIADNVTTVSTDNELDSEAIRSGQTMIQVYDAPPAARGCCHYLGARLLAWSSAEYPNRIYWTRTDLVHYFRRFDYAGVGDHYEEIIVVSPKANGGWVYKERSIWRLMGDPDDFGNASIERVTTNISLVGASALAQNGETDYLLSMDGVYEFDGYRGRKVSAVLDPIFNGEAVAIGSGEVMPAMNKLYIETSVLEVSGDLLYVSYPGGASTSPSHTAVYNRVTKVWAQDTRGFRAICVQGNAAGTLVGIGAALYNLDNGQTDAGSAIAVVYQSSYRHQGAPDNDKQYWGLKIKHALGAQQFAVKVFFGDEPIPSATTLTTTLTGSGITEFIFNNQEGVMARSLSVLVECLPGVTTECQIESILVAYTIHPRTTKQWMSDVLSFDHLMECRAVNVERDAKANFELKLLTNDVTAGDMTETNIPVTVTGDPKRRLYPVTLGGTLRGYLWQLGVVESGAPGGKTYQAKLEVRRVPIFLSGARGEKWQPSVRGIR